ncbi:MAG: element excision factor XisH family protein [Spirosomataceae bacterium]
MPAKDAYHQVVREALEKDSWQITHDPFKVILGKKRGYIDLAAEKLLAAQKEGERIAVEIKSFLGVSDLDEFEDALGQFLIYKLALEKKEPDRVLYLAVPAGFYEDFFDDAFFLEVIECFGVCLIVFDEIQSTIVKWKK